MAENGNRGPNESFRRNQSSRKRREPPIIDATATELSEADKEAGATAQPDVEPGREGEAARMDETGPGDHAEPVLFGAGMRNGPAGVDEPVASAPAVEEAPESRETSPAPPSEVDPAVSSAADFADSDPAAANREAESHAMGEAAGAPPPRPSRRSPMSILLGILVLALLGSIAGLLYTEPQRTRSGELSASLAAVQGKVAALEARPDPAKTNAEVATLGRRTDALDSQLTSLKSAIADLNSRLGAIAAETDASKARLAASGQTASEPQQAATARPAPPADLTALSSRVDELAQRIDAVRSEPPAAAPPPPPTDLAPMEGRIADLDRRMGDLGRRIDLVAGTVASVPKFDPGPLQASIAALEHRLAPLEASLTAPKAGDRVTEARAVGSADATRAAPLAVVAQALDKALSEGRPFASELDALRGLGVEETTLAHLTPMAAKGAPTLEALKTRWAALDKDVLAASRPKGSDNVLDRWAAEARSLVQVRRVDAASGEDPGSTVSRIGAALDRGDLAGALADWAKLPEAGRRASQDWAAEAQARLDAETTAQALLTRAITMLANAKG